jgi:hypothetical protein
MDLRLYFQTLAEIEQTIETDCIVVTSLATADGGKAGVVREVSRGIAAKLFAESRARRATDAERAEYRARIDRAVAAAEQERLSSRVQVTVLADPDTRALKNINRPQRG